MSKYIQRFTVIPKELFRVNNGPSVALRDRSVKKMGSYDLMTEAGKVRPKALDPDTYAGWYPLKRYTCHPRVLTGQSTERGINASEYP